MKTRTDTIQDNIIALGGQSVVTTPFGAAVTFACQYALSVDVTMKEYTVTGASVVDTFHGTGSLAAGFEMSLNDGNAATLLLGNNLQVALTWSVTALSTKLSFQLSDCTVEHGTTAIMLVKGGCYASTLDVKPEENNQAFSYPVFKGVGENDVNQKITCSVIICEVGQCKPTVSQECPETGDDYFYKYKSFAFYG